MIFNYDVSDLKQNLLALEADYATQIQDGTDYDTILTPGNYYCPNAASCATMTNLPPISDNGAHRLIILELTPFRHLQIVIMNYVNPSIWSRYHNGAAWQAWRKVDTYATMTNIANPVEPTPKASQAYTVGDFVWIAETLYVVTANISNGGTMTVGTNIANTTIGAELKAIKNKNTIVNSGTIPSSADLNNYTTPGVYDAASTSIAGSLSHCPTGSAFSLLVLKKGSYTNQLLTAGFDIFTRTRTSSGWGHWFKTTLTDTGS